MKDSIRKVKSFGIGLCMAGVAVIGAGQLPISQGTCVGSCGQCSACGFTALPVVLFLAGKRWKLAAKIRLLLTRPVARVREKRAIGYSSEEKLS